MNVKFYINNLPLFSKKLDISQKLSSVREICKSYIPNDAIFLSPDGCKININDESEYLFSELIPDLIVHMSSKNIRSEIIKPSISKKNTPIQGSKLIKAENGLNIYLYPNMNFTPEKEKQAIKIIMCGELGNGKTTLINSFVNYLLGVQFGDNFRYKIINDNPNLYESQVFEISKYCIDGINGNPPLIIIDIPGFNNIEDIEENITHKLGEYIINQLFEINAVCLVLNSHITRISMYQKYLFNNIFNLFSDDIKNNFLFMLTFCDGKNSIIDKSLKNGDYKDIFPDIKESCFFNNSGIFESGDNNFLGHEFFDLGMKCIKIFIEKIIKFKSKSLNKTKEVIKEGQSLEKNIEIGNISLTKALNKVDEAKSLLKDIKNLKGDINYNNKFNLISQSLKNIKTDLTSLYKELLDKQDLIFEGIKRLNGISLNKNKLIYSGESYKELIEIEKDDRRPGWKKRVEYLEKKKFIHELSKKENNILKDISKFINESLAEF